MDQQLENAQKFLDASRLLLEETRQSIERCERLPKLDTLTAMRYHRPETKLKPLS